MALIFCLECGKEYSDKANACPNCGCPTFENVPLEKDAYGTTNIQHNANGLATELDENRIDILNLYRKGNFLEEYINKCKSKNTVINAEDINSKLNYLVEVYPKGKCSKCNNEILLCDKCCSYCGVKNELFISENNEKNEEIVIDTKNFRKSIKATSLLDILNENQSLIKSRKEELKMQGIAHCPKCLSSSLSASKKGFGIGKAIIGATLLMNPIGLIGGNLGAKKIRITCLNCGYQYWAGKR